MKKINPFLAAAIILIDGFFPFKIKSFFGYYVRIEDGNACWNLAIFGTK
jgi:hypothetical protein